MKLPAAQPSQPLPVLRSPFWSTTEGEEGLRSRPSYGYSAKENKFTLLSPLRDCQETAGRGTRDWRESRDGRDGLIWFIWFV